ncbi:MAG: hypothetical protein J6R89_04660, partial [Clostridia bacterium]|nr:hypothetical protein [Clostridia bacterium]
IFVNKKMKNQIFPRKIGFIFNHTAERNSFSRPKIPPFLGENFRPLRQRPHRVRPSLFFLERSFAFSFRPQKGLFSSFL